MPKTIGKPNSRKPCLLACAVGLAAFVQNAGSGLGAGEARRRSADAVAALLVCLPSLEQTQRSQAVVVLHYVLQQLLRRRKVARI